MRFVETEIRVKSHQIELQNQALMEAALFAQRNEAEYAIQMSPWLKQESPAEAHKTRAASKAKQAPFVWMRSSEWSSSVLCMWRPAAAAHCSHVVPRGGDATPS